MNSQVITLGGGCFWCLEAVFLQVRGVLSVQSGYCNGFVNHPSYEQVCSGRTGHVEVVRVEFDPTQIALEDLLGIFFATHDPTALNRQGNDVGTQYRSGIYVSEAGHAQRAKTFLDGLNAQNIWGAPVVTELRALEMYFPAEDYHQNYHERNPHQGYCMYVVGPKVAKFRQQFKQYLVASET